MMDKFLRQQTAGKLVDTQNEFTVDRRRSRETLLQSIPAGHSHDVLSLLERAVWQLGFRPSEKILHFHGTKSNAPYTEINLPEASPAFIQTLIKELRAPFGPDSAASTLARAIFRATALSTTVTLVWSPASFTEGFFEKHMFQLSQHRLSPPDDLPPFERQGLRVVIAPLGTLVTDGYSHTLRSRAYDLMAVLERLLPLESLFGEVSGYFAYRTKAFTALRSYATLPPDRPTQERFRLDLWKGPYSRTDDRTVLLDKREPGQFLFLRWRPNYGTPTFLHHNLTSELQFGEQDYHATFMVDSNDFSPYIHLVSDGSVSDRLPVKGPPGLRGLVIWPGLSRDLWGTRLVEDDNYEAALIWAQSQVDATARVLSDNLEAVIERLLESNLLKRSYRDETVAKMRTYWGRPS